MPLKDILIYCGTGAGMCVAEAAFFTLIAMMAGNKTVGAAACLLAGILLFIGAASVYGPLSQEEYYYQPKAVYEAMYGDSETSIIVMGGDEDTEMVKIPNPLYISDPQRKWYELVLDCNPTGQALELSALKLERPLSAAVYDLAEILICGAAGVLLLRRKDLK